MLTNDQREEVIRLRLERAKITFKEVEALMRQELWVGAINRIYYVCYYMVSALLIKYKIEATTHSGVRTMLGLHFIKEGKLSKEMAHYFNIAFTKRQTGDYDDFLGVTRDDAIELYEGLPEFIEAIKELIKD